MFIEFISVIYIFLSLVVSAFEMMACVLVLNYYHRPAGQNPSGCIDKMVIYLISDQKHSEGKISMQTDEDEVATVSVIMEKNGYIDWKELAIKLDQVLFWLFLVLLMLLVGVVICVTMFSKKPRSNEPLAGFGYTST